MSDPTQEGGQDIKPTANARNAAMAQIAQNAHANVAEDLRPFDEETGAVAQEERAEPQETQSPAVEPEKPAEQPRRTRKIIVDGQESEVEEDRIIEAGLRTLQKETAADRRLQEAAALKRQAEQLLQSVRTGQPESAPSQDVPSPAQATNGFNPETLNTLVPSLEQHITQRVMTTLTAQQAVEKFREEFPDIAKDPDLWQLAVIKNQSRIDHAAAVGAPLGDDLDAYRKFGAEIRAKFGKAAVVSEEKVERKRTITAIPAVNAKTPAPQEQKPKSTSELIEEMRKLRSQGYRSQGFQRLKA